MQSNQAFLHHRGDESPVLCIDEASIETAGAGRRRSVLDEEQPFVCTKRLVEPDRMIEARGLEFWIHPGNRVRQQTGIEQMHVRCVGEYALMKPGIIRHLA